MNLRTSALAAVLVLPRLALAQAVLPQPPPQIVTSASGTAKLAPDRANLVVGVQTRAATAAAAARDNAARQQDVISAIVAAGVARQQIGTENYSVSAETQFDRNGQNPKVTGYVVSNSVRVEIRRVDQVGAVIDAALGKGANQIQSLDFFSSNNDPARRQALSEAIGKARGDAEAMARAAGGKLGQLLELSTAEEQPRPITRGVMTMAKAAATPIEAGELTVAVQVTARWQYVAGQ